MLNSDQEPSIEARTQEVNRVKRVSDVEVVCEDSPVGESQSNGDAERGIREVKGQMRTMRGAMDSRYEERISPDHPALSWLARHAGSTITRYMVGIDGRTAHERLRGRIFRKEVVEFAECVWYLTPQIRGSTGVGSRWSEGIWLGIREESGEARIGTEDGVIKVRSVRRKASGKERWKKELLDTMKGTPWRPTVQETARLMRR